MGQPLTRPVRVGMIGCGAISAQYLATIARLPQLELTAVADRDAARAERVAADTDARAMQVGELLADPAIDAVLNLTIPAAHAEVALQTIAAGKIIYGEKPLAVSVADARRMVDAAAAAGVRLGCAPDTVLGTGIQTSRKAIDDGLIGTPVAATATMVTPGHERWHPDPDFYYQPGGGPLLDMGPYYVTALVTLLGPVTDVVGMSARPGEVRTIGSGPRAGPAGARRDRHARHRSAASRERRPVHTDHELRRRRHQVRTDRGARPSSVRSRSRIPTGSAIRCPCSDSARRPGSRCPSPLGTSTPAGATASSTSHSPRWDRATDRWPARTPRAGRDGVAADRGQRDPAGGGGLERRPARAGITRGPHRRLIFVGSSGPPTVKAIAANLSPISRWVAGSGCSRSGSGCCSASPGPYSRRPSR